MHCNLYPMSSFLCGCECDYSLMYSASLRIKSSRPRVESTNESSCYCNYNPFTDQMDDAEIHDLSFALRKIAVMKCQMKKWRIERLQLESETRSLKNRLQSLGVKVSKTMTEDPLIIHYREQNVRLEEIKETLEMKIQDLQKVISEHELFRNPCKGIQIIRERMLMLHKQSQRDKEKLKQTIIDLKIKLAEVGGESSCAGVNRLRATLCELIDQRGVKLLTDNKEQSITVVETSSEKFTTSSKSCDDMQVKNKQVRTENQNVRQEIRPTVNDSDVDTSHGETHAIIVQKLNNDERTVVKETEPNVQSQSNENQVRVVFDNPQKYDDDKTIKMKLIEGNDMINNLTKQLNEEDSAIQSLQNEMTNDIEKMRINNETLSTEIVMEKEKLKICEIKVEELLKQLEKRSLDFSGTQRLENEIKMIQLRFDELRIERDKLLDKLNTYQNNSLNKNDETNKVLEIEDMILSDSASKNTILQIKTDVLVNQQTHSQEEIDGVKQKTQNIPSLMKQKSGLVLKVTDWEEKLSTKRDKTVSGNAILSSNSNVSEGELRILEEKSKTHLNGESNSQVFYEKNIKDYETELIKYKNDTDELNKIIEKIKNEKNECMKDWSQLKLQNSHLEISNTKLKDTIVELNNTVSNLTNKLAMADELKDAALLESNKCKKELDQMIINLNIAHNDNNNVKKEREALKNQISKMQKEFSSIGANFGLKKIINKSSSKISVLHSEDEHSNRKNDNLQDPNTDSNRKTETENITHDNSKRNLESDMKKVESSHSRENIFANDNLSCSEGDNSISYPSHVKITEKSRSKNLDSIETNDLNEKLNSLKNQLLNCHIENKKLQTDMNNMKRQYEQLDRDMMSLKNELEVSRNYNEVIKRDSTAVQNENQIQKREIDALKMENVALKDEGTRLHIENSNIRNKLDKLKNANTDLNSELPTLKIHLAKCQSEKDKLSSELIRLEHDCVKYKNKVDMSTSAVETYNKKSGNSNVHEVESSESSFNDSNDEKQNLLSALSNMRTEVDELKRHLLLKDAELEEGKVSKDEMVALKNNLSKCQEALEISNYELILMKKKINIRESKDEVAEDQLQVVDEKIVVEKNRKDTESEDNVLKKQLNKLRLNINETKVGTSSKNILSEESNELKNSFAQLRQDLEKCLLENKRLERKLDKRQNDAITFDKESDGTNKTIVKVAVKKDFGHVNREMDEIELQRNSLEQYLIKMREEIENTRAERNKLRADIAIMKTNEDELLSKHDEMRSGQKNSVDDVNKFEREVERLRAENDKVKSELESALKELNSAQQYNKEIQTRRDKDKEGEKVILNFAEYRDLEKSTKEVEYLRRENNELMKNLEKLKNYVDKFETENEILKVDTDDNFRLKKALEEMEKWRQIAEELKKENGVLSNNLEEALEDLKKIKRDPRKMIERNDSLQSEPLTESIEPEGGEQRQREVERLTREIERLKNENEILNSNGDDRLSPMQQLSNQMDEWKRTAEKDLNRENITLKNDFAEIGEDREQSLVGRQLKNTPQILSEQANAQVPSDTLDISNELICGLDVIRMKIEKQRNGVLRIRENIGNIAKQIWHEFSKYTVLDDSIVLETMNPIIIEILELSNDLSMNIFSAEKELVNLAKLWKTRWEENTRLKKLVEDLRDGPNSKTRQLSECKAMQNSDIFNPESWLDSLTLTQLADLHDKICLLTSNLVRRDSIATPLRKPNDTLSLTSHQDQLQDNYEMLNKKIAALQRQIAQKQTEAGKKVLEMHETLRREQLELLRISEAISEERKRNMMRHLTINRSPCWLNDCTAECAKNVKFISNIARRS